MKIAFLVNKFRISMWANYFDKALSGTLVINVSVKFGTIIPDLHHLWFVKWPCLSFWYFTICRNFHLLQLLSEHQLFEDVFICFSGSWRFLYLEFSLQYDVLSGVSWIPNWIRSFVRILFLQLKLFYQDIGRFLNSMSS